MNDTRLALVFVCLALGCREPSTPTYAAPVAIASPLPASSKPVPESTHTPAMNALAWDPHLGWEPHFDWAPGETSRTRPEGSYLVLSYVLAHPEWLPTLAARSAGVALRDKPLVAEPAELCHPSLHATVVELAPDRVLLHVNGDIDDTQRDCLAALPVRNIFLSACRHDGALTLVDPCQDGDAFLARLVAEPVLREKVRGLAIGFGERASWALLPRLRRLEYLAIRGTALANIDLRAALELCTLTDLRHVDAFDADHPGQRFEAVPPACVARWESFSAWTAPEIVHGTACSLRRLFVWELDSALRQRLEAVCPDLEVQVVQP